MCLGGFPKWSCIFGGQLYKQQTPVSRRAPLGSPTECSCQHQQPLLLGNLGGMWKFCCTKWKPKGLLLPSSTTPHAGNPKPSQAQSCATDSAPNHPKHTPAPLILLFSPEHPNEDPCRAIFHDKILHLTLDSCSVCTQHGCRSGLQQRKTCLCYKKVVRGWTCSLGSKEKQKISTRGESMCRTGLVQHLCSERSSHICSGTTLQRWEEQFAAHLPATGVLEGAWILLKVLAQSSKQGWFKACL